jgi:hypothetical protein
MQLANKSWLEGVMCRPKQQRGMLIHGGPLVRNSALGVSDKGVPAQGPSLRPGAAQDAVRTPRGWQGWVRRPRLTARNSPLLIASYACR